MNEGGQKTLIKVTNLQQSFKLGEEDIKVLHNCSFTIQKETFNIIYGPSGSGKSTLLNVLSGIQDPTSGTVTYESQEIYKYTPEQLAYFRAKSIGVVYQQNYWVKSLNVIENVSIPLYFLGYRRAAAAKIAITLADKEKMKSTIEILNKRIADWEIISKN